MSIPGCARRVGFIRHASSGLIITYPSFLSHYSGSKRGGRFYSVKAAGASPVNPEISWISEPEVIAAHVPAAAGQ